MALFVYFDIRRLPRPPTADLVGPKLYPEILAILLAVFAGLLFVGVVSSHQGDPSITARGMVWRFLPIVLFSALYVILLPALGFLVATSALLVASFYLLGERRLWVCLLIAVGCTLGVYLLFAQGLDIPLKALPG
jgi:hypothetical protein